MSETRAFAVAHADSRTEQAYAVLKGQKADLLLTDPPYCLLTRRRKGGDLRQRRNRKIDRDPVTRFETVSEYRAFTEAWLSASVKHLVPSAPLVIWTNVLGRDPIASLRAGSVTPGSGVNSSGRSERRTALAMSRL